MQHARRRRCRRASCSTDCGCHLHATRTQRRVLKAHAPGQKSGTGFPHRHAAPTRRRTSSVRRRRAGQQATCARRCARRSLCSGAGEAPWRGEAVGGSASPLQRRQHLSICTTEKMQPKRRKADAGGPWLAALLPSARATLSGRGTALYSFPTALLGRARRGAPWMPTAVPHSRCDAMGWPACLGFVVGPLKN